MVQGIWRWWVFPLHFCLSVAMAATEPDPNVDAFHDKGEANCTIALQSIIYDNGPFLRVFWSLNHPDAVPDSAPINMFPRQDFRFKPLTLYNFPLLDADGEPFGAFQLVGKHPHQLRFTYQSFVDPLNQWFMPLGPKEIEEGRKVNLSVRLGSSRTLFHSYNALAAALEAGTVRRVENIMSVFSESEEQFKTRPRAMAAYPFQVVYDREHLPQWVRLGQDRIDGLLKSPHFFNFYISVTGLDPATQDISHYHVQVWERKVRAVTRTPLGDLGQADFLLYTVEFHNNVTGYTSTFTFTTVP